MFILYVLTWFDFQNTFFKFFQTCFKGQCFIDTFKFNIIIQNLFLLTQILLINSQNFLLYMKRKF